MSNSNLVKAASNGIVPVENGNNPVGLFPVVLLYEGIPYRLVKQKLMIENNPCRLCDLANKCTVNADLSSLCLTKGRDRSWFFIEDWDIVDKCILDFLTRSKVDICE